MQSANDLKQLLFGINHKSYPAYKSTRGAYQFPRYTLSIDHVQGDPFAAPSRVSVHINEKPPHFQHRSTTHMRSASPFRITCCASCARDRTVLVPREGLRQKRSAWRQPLRPGNSRAHCLRFKSVRRQSYRQHGNRLSRQWPHHRLAGTDPHSLRLPAGLRGKIASVPQSGSESMRRCRPSL